MSGCLTDVRLLDRYGDASPLNDRNEWQMALPANRSMRADAIIPLSAPAKSSTTFLSLGLVSTGPLGIWLFWVAGLSFFISGGSEQGLF
jgi:hypothetical protein